VTTVTDKNHREYDYRHNSRASFCLGVTPVKKRIALSFVSLLALCYVVIAATDNLLDEGFQERAMAHIRYLACQGPLVA
jgi:hypothetical protein